MPPWGVSGLRCRCGQAWLRGLRVRVHVEIKISTVVVARTPLLSLPPGCLHAAEAVRTRDQERRNLPGTAPAQF